MRMFVIMLILTAGATLSSYRKISGGDADADDVMIGKVFVVVTITVALVIIAELVIRAAIWGIQ